MTPIGTLTTLFAQLVVALLRARVVAIFDFDRFIAFRALDVFAIVFHSLFGLRESDNRVLSLAHHLTISSVGFFMTFLLSLLQLEALLAEVEVACLIASVEALDLSNHLLTLAALEVSRDYLYSRFDQPVLGLGSGFQEMLHWAHDST